MISCWKRWISTAMLVYWRVYFIAWFRQVRWVVWFMHFRCGTCFFRRQCIRDGSAGICSCYYHSHYKMIFSKNLSNLPPPNAEMSQESRRKRALEATKRNSKNSLCVGDLKIWVAHHSSGKPQWLCTCCCSAQKRTAKQLLRVTWRIIPGLVSGE